MNQGGTARRGLHSCFQAIAEIDLAFARQVRQRQKHLLVRLLQSPNRVLHHDLAALVAVLVPQPLEDPLGRMPLLLRRLAVECQDLVDDWQKGRQLPLLSRLSLTIAGRLMAGSTFLTIAASSHT